MFPRLLLPGLVSTLAAVMPLSAADPAPDTEAYFARFVQPVLESTCAHCHNADKLYTSTRLPADDDMVMPPSKEPALTAVQSDHLKAWITAGAKWPAGLTLATQPRMQFVRDIQPILEQNCVSCHRPDKLKGDLDMTTLAATIKGGENGTSLVAFDPAASPLYTHTTLKEDDDELMPPVKSGGPLKAEQQEKLKRWVQQGAPWPEGVVLVPKTKTEDRPPSPDTIELTGKIRELIVAGSKEASADQLKGYQETVKKTGKEFAMVPIPGGEFLMGSPETEKDRKPDEGPQVKVKIEPFWMGATEVTWDLYMPFMVTPDARWKDGSKKTLNPKDEPVDAISSPTAPYTDMTFGMGQDGYPAISMTEHAAQTGHFYRLPTEAEWEYAARAGTTTAWSFGDDASKIGDYAWYFENSDGKTQQVAQKKPNPWGLHDIHGNAAEWTLDQYDPTYYGAMAALVQTGAAPLPWNKPVTLYPRSVRGGTWDDDPKDLRSAARRGSKDTWKVMDPQLPKSIWYHTSAQFLGMRLVRPLRVPSVEEMHDAWNLGIKNEVK